MVEINYNFINMILVVILVGALILFMNNAAKNVEAMKQNPLQYAESILGGKCSCFCTDEKGFIDMIYNAEPQTLDAGKWYVNISQFDDLINKDS